MIRQTRRNVEAGPVRGRATRVLCAAGCVTATLCGSAAAAAPNRPVHVVTELASPCLDRATFERALFARITRPRGDDRSEATVVQVRVDVEGEQFAGRVTIAEPGEEPRERIVRSSSCADVALSAVLVAALALGGEPEDDPDRPRHRELADDAIDDRRPATTTPSPSPWTRAVGVHGGLAAAGSGEASVGGDVFGELSTLRSGVSPGLRIALAYATAERSERGVTMGVSTLTVRLEPSLVRIQSGPIAGRLVLSLEGGAAFASASGATRAESATRPWLRGGAQAEIALDVVGPVALEIAAGALGAFIRDDFVVDPSGFGLRVPSVVPVGRLGFLARLR